MHNSLEVNKYLLEAKQSEACKKIRKQKTQWVGLYTILPLPILCGIY